MAPSPAGRPGGPEGEGEKRTPAAGTSDPAVRRPRTAPSERNAGKRPRPPSTGGGDEKAAGRAKPGSDARPKKRVVDEPAGAAGEDRQPKKTADGEAAQSHEGEASEERRQAKAPWHFKFIVVGSVIYLGWRLYQGISWLAHHL